MEPVRTLIADDHPHFRDGLRALLLSAPDVEVVGEARDGEEAISLAARLQPDSRAVLMLEPAPSTVSKLEPASGSSVSKQEA